MRISFYFDQLTFLTSAGSSKPELCNAVIVALRIYAGAKFGDLNFVYPEVASIVIANEHRPPLAVYNGNACRNKFVCSVRKVSFARTRST